MRQLCNLVYADLAQNRNQVQIAELNKALAPPEEKERIQAEVNQQVMASMGLQPLALPKRSPKRRSGS